MKAKRKTAVVVFARRPERGKVKTRLAAVIGPSRAAALHEACLQSTAGLVASLPASLDKYLYFTGDIASARRTARRLRLPAGIVVRVQKGGSLGDRLASALQQQTQDGYRHVLFLGSDSPTLPRERIVRAAELLRRRDVVIGPALDGGYYLIGAGRWLPEIFRGIDWGTERAFRQTLARLQRAGRRIGLLPAWYDVDRAEDLRRLAREVRRRRSPYLRPVRRWLETYLSSKLLDEDFPRVL